MENVNQAILFEASSETAELSSNSSEQILQKVKVDDVLQAEYLSTSALAFHQLADSASVSTSTSLSTIDPARQAGRPSLGSQSNQMEEITGSSGQFKGSIYNADGSLASGPSSGSSNGVGSSSNGQFNGSIYNADGSQASGPNHQNPPNNSPNRGGSSGGSYRDPGYYTDNWPGVNWPDDGDPSDPSFNFNPSIYDENGHLRPTVSGFGGDGILQELYAMLDALKNYSGNSGMIWPKLIELIGNIASNPTLANDPDIKAFFANFVKSDDVGNINLESQLILMVTMQVWGNVLANGGSEDQARTAAKAFMQQLKNQFNALGLTENNPIAGNMVKMVDSMIGNDGGNGFINFWVATYYSNGVLAASLGGNTFYCCPPDDKHPDGHGALGWMQFLDGQMGMFLAGTPNTPNSGSNIGSVNESLFKLTFDVMTKNVKDPGKLLMLLFVMLGMGKDSSYQSQLGGEGKATDFLSDSTSLVSELIAEFSAGFMNNGSPDGNAAYMWCLKIEDLLSNTINKSAYTDDSYYKSIAGVVNGILNTHVMNGSADLGPISSLLQNPTPDNMSKLANFLTNCANGLIPTNGILDLLNTASKTVTDRSQTIGTLTSGVTQKDNQIVNVMNTALNDSTSGFVAAESTAVKNQLVN